MIDAARLALQSTELRVGRDQCPRSRLLFGGAGADWILGDGGDDYLDGGVGDDALWGGAGADALVGDAGDDMIDGDGSYADATKLDYTLPQPHGNDYIDAGAGADEVLSGERCRAEKSMHYTRASHATRKTEMSSKVFALESRSHMAVHWLQLQHFTGILGTSSNPDGAAEGYAVSSVNQTCLAANASRFRSIA